MPSRNGASGRVAFEPARMDSEATEETVNSNFFSEDPAQPLGWPGTAMYVVGWPGLRSRVTRQNRLFWINLKRDIEASKNYEIFLKNKIHQEESILFEIGIIAIVELKKNLPRMILLRFWVSCLTLRWSLKIQKETPKFMLEEVLINQVITQHRFYGQNLSCFPKMHIHFIQ
jgi:hypothetical protein